MASRGLHVFPNNAPDQSAMTDKEISQLDGNNAPSSAAQALELDADREV